MLKLHDIAHWPTEHISQRVLYLLIALTVIVFALFYFVAYDRPFADDPSFNAPLFTDLLLVFMLLLVVLSCGLSVWAVMRSVRRLRGKGSGMENNVHLYCCFPCGIRDCNVGQWEGLSRLVLAQGVGYVHLYFGPIAGDSHRNSDLWCHEILQRFKEKACSGIGNTVSRYSIRRQQPTYLSCC